METEPDKARPNTLLVILTLFDLIAAVAGAAPFVMASIISGNDTEPTNFPLIISVPAVAIILVLIAWVVNLAERRKAAIVLAAVPLFWGMMVLVTLLSPS